MQPICTAVVDIQHLPTGKTCYRRRRSAEGPSKEHTGPGPLGTRIATSCRNSRASESSAGPAAARSSASVAAARARPALNCRVPLLHLDRTSEAGCWLCSCCWGRWEQRLAAVDCGCLGRCQGSGREVVSLIGSSCARGRWGTDGPAAALPPTPVACRGGPAANRLRGDTGMLAPDWPQPAVHARTGAGRAWVRLGRLRLVAGAEPGQHASADLKLRPQDGGVAAAAVPRPRSASSRPLAPPPSLL